MYTLRAAVDSCVLLDLAAEMEDVARTIRSIRLLKAKPLLFVTPTVLGHVGDIAFFAETEQDRELAKLALGHCLRYHSIQCMSMVPVGAGIVQELAKNIERADLIPVGETKASETLAEAALGCATYLLTTDPLLLGIDPTRLTAMLTSSDVCAPVICRPDKALDLMRSTKAIS